MSSQNIAWVRSPMTWGTIPGWAETIWSIEFMAPSLVSKGFLIDMLDFLPLVLHGILWDFPNMQASKGGEFSDPDDITWYYPPIGYYDEVF